MPDTRRYYRPTLRLPSFRFDDSRRSNLIGLTVAREHLGSRAEVMRVIRPCLSVANGRDGATFEELADRQPLSEWLMVGQNPASSQ